MVTNRKTKSFENIRVGIFSAFKANAGIFIAFLFLFLVASFMSTKFLTFNNIMSLLRLISTNALIAFAMTYVILTGGIDLSVGSLMSLGGCLTAVLVAWMDVPTILAVIIALCAGLLCGAFNGIVITKMKMPPFIVTLATMNIIRGISYVITDGRPVILNDDIFGMIGAGFFTGIPLPAIYIVIAFIFLWILLNRTRFGRNVYAIGGNIVAAKYSGINTIRVRFNTYLLTGAFSSFAGIVLSSRLNSGQPIIGQGAELDAIAACIVGGVSITGGSGTLFGTLLGCLIIGIISNGLNLLGVDAFIQLIIKGIIIIISVYIDTVRKKS